MNWMMFRAPGPEKIHGYDVEYKVIETSEREAYIAAGWFDTAVAAGDAHAKALSEAATLEAEEADDRAAATLEEVHQKLEELGVVFDRRLGRKKLLKLIHDTLAERATAAGTPPAADSQG